MSAARPTRGCPACGARPQERAEVVVAGKLAIDGGPLTLVRCDRCGARFQPVVPSVDELARWYDYMAHIPANVETSPLLARRLRRMLSAFEPVRRSGRLLEVGCGGGLFVRTATAAGWEVWGTEVSPSCAAILRPLLGDRLYQGTIEEAPFPLATFDGVALIEVIEHLPDPSVYVAAIARLLRPGGRLYMTTPNAAGSAAHVLGTRWRAFTNEHLNYFDRRSLALLLDRHGFSDLRVTASNLDLLVLATDRARRLLRAKRPAGSVGAPTSLIAPAAAPSNGTTNHDRSAHRRAQLADLAIEAVNRIASATRLGDTLRVIATRR
jgi:SAM-dependent methyltransferase